MPTKNDAPFPKRLAALTAALRARDLTHLLVSNPVDVAYLTGFLGGDSYLLLSPSSKIIISDFRYKEDLEPLEALFTIHIRSTSMTQAVADLLAKTAAETCAFQAEHVTVVDRDALAKAAPKAKLKPTVGLIPDLRRVKDDHEVALIRKAIKIQEAALTAALPSIKPGQTESAIASRLDAEMKARGASATAFDTIVAARANGSRPHHHTGQTKAAANQPLLIDWGAVHQGYRGDLTRTFALGKWPKKIAEIYAIVLDAHTAAAEALAPGKRSSEIDKVARNIIAKAGHAEHFGHGLGHGLGLNTHEEPRLHHLLTSTTLQPGNVVTIEPGIYLPGIGGVRLEDDYLITPSGPQRLSTLPRDLDWATL
ncbi:MAG: M24 family metallopeptidase [Phycisphaeraceae bacterium]|nr:MAG: M24 family metallopeptidase [Phycisphaeraceae bacterium]